MADSTLQRPVTVRVTDLVKRFDGRAVLNGVNLEIQAGETMVIMGGSGCGKTTLLRHMIGSLIPDEGVIELFGQNICPSRNSTLFVGDLGFFFSQVRCSTR